MAGGEKLRIKKCKMLAQGTAKCAKPMILSTVEGPRLLLPRARRENTDKCRCNVQGWVGNNFKHRIRYIKIEVYIYVPSPVT